MKCFISVSLFVVFFAVSPVLAHTDSSGENSTSGMMRGMMGASTFEIMEEMEDHMMGDEQHEQMEVLMDKLIKGTLSSEEQQEMIRIMQDSDSAPGAMTMMMRMMNPQILQQNKIAARGGIMDFPSIAGIGAQPIVYWITVILIWTLLASGIFAIWKWISRQKKKK